VKNWLEDQIAWRQTRCLKKEGRVLTVADMVDTSVEKDAGLNQGAKAQQQNVLRIWTWISGVRFGDFVVTKSEALFRFLYCFLCETYFLLTYINSIAQICDLKSRTKN